MKRIDVGSYQLVAGDVVYTACHQLVEITEVTEVGEFLVKWQGSNLVSGLTVEWEGNRNQSWQVRR